MPDLLATAYDVLEVVVPLAMLPVVAHHHRPHVAFAWLVLIWALPILGVLAWSYLALYRPRRLAKRRAAMEDLQALKRARPAPPGPAPEELGLAPDLVPFARLIARLGTRQLGGTPLIGGNRAEVLDEPGRLVARLLEDVAAARRSLDLLYYQIAGDEAGRRLAEAVIAAAGRGVRCRLLAGAFASHWESSRSFFQELAPRMQEAGVDVRPLEPMNPLRRGLGRVDLRNHRKLAVFDGGEVGYVGSENIHDPDMGLEEGIWHELSVRLEGPIGRHLQLVFLQDWIEHGGALAEDEELAAPEPAPGGLPAQVVWWGSAEDGPAVKALVAALGQARERVVLASPYFVPDRPFMMALVAAALRDVRIDLIVPAQSDRRIADAAARAHFEELLQAGVRIHLFPSGLLHAKCVTLDDRVAVVGSANADRRSLYLDEEIVVLLYDEETTRRVRRRQEAWIEASRPVELEAFRARPRLRRTADDVAALASPLL